jgi:hypothetical protein
MIDEWETSPMHSPGSATSTPRWVKAFGIAAIVVVLLIIILHLTGYGLGGGHMLHSGVTEHGMQQP